MAITFDTRNARRPGGAPAAVVARITQRARAFAAAQRHSRLVSLLRILLPLAALATLAAYVLVVAVTVKLYNRHVKIPDIIIGPDDLTMKEPSYFDFTKDGRYEVRAKRAVVALNQKAPIKLIDVSGDLTQTSGTVTKLKAKHGLFEQKKGELELFDGIEIDGTNGLMARLSRAMIYSKEGKIVSVDPVSATMPTGTIQAAAMTMLNKSRIAQFRGQVAVHLLPQQGQGVGIGKDMRQPVDIRSEELDVDDNLKTAHFRGKVVALQGETMLQAPTLLVKYEGKAASGLASATQAAPGKEAGKDSAQVTFLWVRDGVEVTAGTDRRITSETADFDVAADTALFEGNVVATQEKNVLKGGRLTVDRKGGKTRLETPGDGGRIAATFVQKDAAPTKQPKRQQVAEAVNDAVGLAAFKADRNAPMNVDADTLDILDASNKAVFKGNVVAKQGDLVLRTADLTAFYTGQTGMGFSSATADNVAFKGKGPEKGKGKIQDKALDKGPEKAPEKAEEKGEITRLEARHGVTMVSKDQSASAKWADFDVKANTALLGGGVTVTRATNDPLKPDVIVGERLKVDLTTGISQFENEGPALPPQPPVAKAPAISGSPVETSGATPAEKVQACAPGRTCVLLYPSQVKDRAVGAVKKMLPAADGQ
jgi:lipopolysaccharide export system protein LptA